MLNLAKVVDLDIAHDRLSTASDACSTAQVLTNS